MNHASAGNALALPNVIPLQPPKVRARDRNRRNALDAIIPRLKHLRSRSDLYSVSRGITVDHAIIGDLVCTFHETADGVYFRIEIAGTPTPLMTGYYDNRGRQERQHGPTHIMSWRRGWEDRLF